MELSFLANGICLRAREIGKPMTITVISQILIIAEEDAHQVDDQGDDPPRHAGYRRNEQTPDAPSLGPGEELPRPGRSAGRSPCRAGWAPLESSCRGSW